MLHTEPQTNGAGDLSSLVNAQRIRSSIKRLFQNTAKEVMAELLQNSARALASHVTITTTETTVVIQDNGHGLLDGVNGFHTLLKIAESYFDNETLDAQAPMGLGVCAALSHDKVTGVTFESGTLSLAIDTAKWWEADYAETWFERLQTLAEPVAGLRIIVECAPEFVKDVRTALTPQQSIYSDQLKTSAAQGYAGILDITLDDKPVETGLPDWARVRSPLIETTYMGCPLTIGYNGDHALTASSVLWYGLPIQVRRHDWFQFHLEVREGRPVNPRSPSRQGLIEDDALAALKQFVTDQIFAFLCDPKNRARIKPSHIITLYRLDGERAARECPYVVLAPLLPLGEVSSTEDVDRHGPYTLFTYDEAPVCLASSVRIVTGKEVKAVEYGLSSFLPMIGEAYGFVGGNIARLNVQCVWWKPRGKPRHYFFHRPGKWALGDANTRPTEWKDVTASNVFAYDWGDNSDFSSVDWTIGCINILDFMDALAWAGFNPSSDDRDYDDIHADYEESVLEMIRSVMGRCVRSAFRPYDLPRFMSKHDSPIVSVRFHYRKRVANAITVTNKAGESVRLKLL
ncbi:MAG TPA: ATP-binding protein [Blastocatellia bacterium]|nr:ATP-binding protein [Blastocatellia bacterium]